MKKNNSPIIFEDYKEVKIEYCRLCKKFKDKNQYISKEEFKKIFPKLLYSNIAFNHKPNNFYVQDDILDNPNKKETIKIIATAIVNEKEIEEEVALDVSFQKKICDLCSKIKGGYYEGIFQLRNKENKDYKKVLNEIDVLVLERKNVAITKKIDQKTGTDLYFTDQKLLQAIGQTLYKKYGGTFKKSVKLFSEDRQSSKKVYRMNVLLRLPEFNFGDIVKINNEYYKIISFSKDKITINSLDTLKTKKISNNIDIELIAQKKDYLKTTVIKKKPQIEVLHPKTFQSVPLSNNVEIFNNEINIVIIDDKIYCV
ncbi:MAG: NMD3-related protein [Nanoarchaeota archaeon]